MIIENILSKQIIDMDNTEEMQRLFKYQNSFNYNYKINREQKNYYKSAHDQSDKLYSQDFINLQQMNDFQKIEI